jgi:hypothetical protein
MTSRSTGVTDVTDRSDKPAYDQEIMTTFIPLAQLAGPKTFTQRTASTAAAKHECMLCKAHLRSEREYERHLEQLHPGWAMLFLQKLGMTIARENG